MVFRQNGIHADIRNTFKLHTDGTDSCPFYYREPESGFGSGMGVRDFLAMSADGVRIGRYSIASDQEGAVLKRQVTGTDSCPFYYREYKGQNQCQGQREKYRYVP